ncbi:uncharacterized protein LOC124541122 [Vanessa cardui]|uniref:uncharacterized protein LOC124541122 n=1 Tax=Vanessa cardui TaxID=171605 RepID=UPI001F12F35C|nr:uncharacterized protein LOC124541122 [Vanessa cardui]
MATILFRSVLFVILSIYVFGDEIEMEVQSGAIMKMLREMVNQTSSDSLNLPANSTSIRENITDTFSCENRTYGYYADVDNDCQIFHVCLPSQTPSGRNVTFKWSFICPKETVFNQEVLVCTREIDSIPCEESPDFYDLNMEIGKMVDPEATKEDEPKKEAEIIPAKKENRQPSRKKQNIIMEALLQEAEPIEQLIDEVLSDETTVKYTEMETSEFKPQVEEAKVENDENTRLGTERSLKRTGRKISRGSMKFRSDV